MRKKKPEHNEKEKEKIVNKKRAKTPLKTVKRNLF